MLVFTFTLNMEKSPNDQTPDQSRKIGWGTRIKNLLQRKNRETVSSTESEVAKFPLDIYVYPLPIDPALSLERQLTIDTAKGTALKRGDLSDAIVVGIATDPDIIEIANAKLADALPLERYHPLSSDPDEVLGALFAISDTLPSQRKLELIRPLVKFEQGQYDSIAIESKRGLYLGIALLANDSGSVRELMASAQGFKIPKAIIHVLSPEKILAFYQIYTEFSVTPRRSSGDTFPSLGFHMESVVESMSPTQKKEFLAFLSQRLAPDHPLLLYTQFVANYNFYAIDAPFDPSLSATQILDRIRLPYDQRHPDRNISVEPLAILHLLIRIDQLPEDQKLEQQNQLESFLTQKNGKYLILLDFYKSLQHNPRTLPDHFWENEMSFSERLRALALFSTHFHLSPEMLLRSALDPLKSKDPEYPINTDHVFLLQRFFYALAKDPGYRKEYLPAIQIAQRQLFYLGRFTPNGYDFLHDVGKNPDDTASHLTPLTNSPAHRRTEEFRRRLAENSPLRAQLDAMREMSDSISRMIHALEGTTSPADQQFIDRVAKQGFVVQNEDIPLIEQYIVMLGIATGVRDALDRNLDIQPTLLSAIRKKAAEFHTDRNTDPEADAQIRLYTEMLDNLRDMFKKIPRTEG